MPNLQNPPFMSDISAEQLAFLDSQGISLSQVFDATGMSRSEYREAMKHLDMCLAVGVTPCEKGGHRIRTRSGHCAQCEPANIAFQNRYSQLGYAYIAISQSCDLIKIGCTSDVPDRMRNLNGMGYGGIKDWQWLHAFYVFDCGRVEYNTQLNLRIYRVPRTYIRDGKEVNCLETFKLRHEEALEVMMRNTETGYHYYKNENIIFS